MKPRLMLKFAFIFWLTPSTVYCISEADIVYALKYRDFTAATTLLRLAMVEREIYQVPAYSNELHWAAFLNFPSAVVPDLTRNLV